MTKKEIARRIAKHCDLPFALAQEALQMLFDGIRQTLLDEGRIELRNFGVFVVKRRRARNTRNPRTGATVLAPPKKVVTFKPGWEMKQRVRQLAENPRPT